LVAERGGSTQMSSVHSAHNSDPAAMEHVLTPWIGDRLAVATHRQPADRDALPFSALPRRAS
jgi:hypothetical protein